MTRFESAPLACTSWPQHLSFDQGRPHNLSIRPDSSQRSKPTKWSLDSSQHRFLALSGPKTCPSDRHQANEVVTRFESAPFTRSVRPKNLCVGPASSQRCDDSIRVSTSCLPKLAAKLAEQLSVRPLSSHRSGDSIRVSTSRLPNPAKDLSVGPAPS
jgi:hypothetical protein